MRNILALDIGQRRIGLAIAKENIISTYGIVENTDLTKTIAEINRIVREQGIEQIVIGIPKNKDTFEADKIHKFALELAKTANLPIEYVDETLTSKEAERQLLNSGLDPKSEKYKQEIDKISAQLILEQHLNQ